MPAFASLFHHLVGYFSGKFPNLSECGIIVLTHKVITGAQMNLCELCTWGLLFYSFHLLLDTCYVLDSDGSYDRKCKGPGAGGGGRCCGTGGRSECWSSRGIDGDSTTEASQPDQVGPSGHCKGLPFSWGEAGSREGQIRAGLCAERIL